MEEEDERGEEEEGGVKPRKGDYACQTKSLLDVPEGPGPQAGRQTH